MDLRVLAFVFLTIYSVQGAIPKCCVETSSKFPPHLLKRVERYVVQSRSGACEIDALILHIKNRKFCVGLELKKRLRRHFQLRDKVSS